MATKSEHDWAYAMATYYAARQAYMMAVLTHVDRGCSLSQAHRKARRQKQARDRALALLRQLGHHRDIGVCEP